MRWVCVWSLLCLFSKHLVLSIVNEMFTAKNVNVQNMENLCTCAGLTAHLPSRPKWFQFAEAAKRSSGPAASSCPCSGEMSQIVSGRPKILLQLSWFRPEGISFWLGRIEIIWVFSAWSSISVFPLLLKLVWTQCEHSFFIFLLRRKRTALQAAAMPVRERPNMSACTPKKGKTSWLSWSLAVMPVSAWARNTSSSTTAWSAGALCVNRKALDPACFAVHWLVMRWFFFICHSYVESYFAQGFKCAELASCLGSTLPKQSAPRVRAVQERTCGICCQGKNFCGFKSLLCFYEESREVSLVICIALELTLVMTNS